MIAYTFAPGLVVQVRMLTLVLVILAPISVVLLPQPYNGLVVGICIAVIGGLEWERDRRRNAGKDAEPGFHLPPWGEAGKPTDEPWEPRQDKQ